MFSADAIPGEGSVPSAADPEFDAWIAACQEGFTWLRDPRIVSVAAVQGHAIGAGFQLALACDLRILAEDARLCMKEPALGLVPDLTGTKPLVDIVGLSRAIELCLTARIVSARRPAQLRLAELVVPAADLDGAVADLTAALLATDAAAARATKRLLGQAAGNTLASRPPPSGRPRRPCCARGSPARDGSGRFRRELTREEPRRPGGFPRHVR